jgi:hypothetical protein
MTHNSALRNWLRRAGTLISVPIVALGWVVIFLAIPISYPTKPPVAATLGEAILVIGAAAWTVWYWRKAP